jgi:putative ABC transport system permease protein
MIRAGIRRAFRLALYRRDRWEREVEDEIKLHLTLRAEQLVMQGATPDDAYREAARRFGPLTESRARLLDAARHREQQMHRTEYLDDLRQDVSFAARTLARQKGWTAVTILTLALGIGATTAVFSVVSTLMLNVLPYPHADRIVYVEQQPSQGNSTGIRVTITPSAKVVRAWMQQSHSFEAFVGVSVGPKTLKTLGEPSRVMAADVFPSFPEFAGQRPLRGRMFTAQDILNGGRVVALSETFWRERFGADPGVLGKVITLNDTSYMIAGVMPAALRLEQRTRPADVFLPLDVRDDKRGMAVLGRMRPGVTITAATRELDSIFARTAEFSDGKAPFKTVISTPAQRVQMRDSLLMLTAAVGLVLLVACANVAHLLLARSAARQRELAIRAALGAGRWRLLRQLLTESLILAFLGSGCGVVLGWAGLHGLIALRPSSYDAIKLAHLNAFTLWVAIGLAALSGIVFGVTSAVQSARYSAHDTLKNSATSASASARHHRGRALLVVTEMALSGMLLVGATLLIRSVTNLQRADLGFDPKGLYAVDLPANAHFGETPEARAAFMTEFVSRLRQLPGVRSAAIASVTPGSRSFSIGRLEIDGETPPPKGTTSFVDVNQVEPGFFATMGIGLVQGSTFSDTSAAARQAIINAGFARKHWGDRSALGHRIRIAQSDLSGKDEQPDNSEPWLTIVGVAHDAATTGPGAESSAPLIYTASGATASPNVMVRTNGDAKALAPVAGMLRTMGVRRAPTIDSTEGFLGRALSAPRFIMLVLSIFTGLALTLAGVGLYGVMAYTVTQQTREIGIRVALGASGSRIARGVLGRGAWLAVTGAVIGLIAASWATKMIEHQLHGVTRSDPLSFIAGAIVLVLVAVIACLVPTRRALAVDPMTAIRAD